MVGTAHVYQIYIAATPEEVWRAITDSEWTKRYFHSTSFVEPPVAGAAYRTVLADGRDAVEGIIEEMTPPRVRLVHGDLAYSPLTWAHVKDGWVWVIDALKTLLETGKSLPGPEVVPPVSATPEGDWHRRQGVEANNAVYELLDRDRSPDEDEDMLRGAYAAGYHWQRATAATPENEARART